MNKSMNYLLRYGILMLGVFVLGLGIALTIQGDLGVNPWTVFHIGIGNITGLSVGRITQIVGMVLLVIGGITFKQLPGFGTLLNMIFVGFSVDLFLGSLPEAGGLLLQIVYVILGITLIGLGTGIYISVRLGAGPRDGIMLGLSKLLNWKVGKIRSSMELTVLITGFLLGGPVGIGTVLGVAVGPIVQFSLQQLDKLWEVLLFVGTPTPVEITDD